MQTKFKSETLVGSWSAVLTAVDQGVTFPGLLSFTSDGIIIANEPPGPFESSGQGNWIPKGPSEIAYTFLFLTESVENRLSAKAKVIGSLTYDPKEDGWTGPFMIVVVDADDNRTESDHGNVQCKRIVVEMLD
jgi:hypothetical protein